MSDDLAYAQFQKTVLRLIGVDLASYRQGQMRRRLDALVQRVGARGYAEYARMLERDPARVQEFRDYFTINVTEFFRDPDRFRLLETKVLPELLAKRTALKVWSAACSIGRRAVLGGDPAPRAGADPGAQVLATDVDVTIVERARRADEYIPADAEERLAGPAPEGVHPGPGWHLRRAPGDPRLVDIRLHNLLTPPPTQGFDLILCRNVVIYFTDDAKTVLYEHLVNSLRPGGILFVGGTEMVASAHQLGLSSIGPSFYRKTEAASTVPRPFVRPVLAPPRPASAGAGGRRRPLRAAATGPDTGPRQGFPGARRTP